MAVLGAAEPSFRGAILLNKELPQVVGKCSEGSGP
jgi:hypothetical protein